MKYFKVPDNNENFYPCGIIYTGTINYTSREFKNYFNKNKEKLDKEIVDIFFYTAEECLNLELKKNDIKYLKELVKKEIEFNIPEFM